MGTERQGEKDNSQDSNCYITPWDDAKQEGKWEDDTVCVSVLYPGKGAEVAGSVDRCRRAVMAGFRAGHDSTAEMS